MECPNCHNEVKGNWCPTCKKPVSSGPMQKPGAGAAGAGGAATAAKTGGSQFSNSAAMQQKGTGPIKKDKTIDGFDASNAKQSKYSSHLISKDRASDFGNSTRSKRWSFAENIGLLLLLLSSILGLVAFMLPFLSDAFGTGVGDGTAHMSVSGMQLFGLDWTASGSTAPLLATMALLTFVSLIVLAIFSAIKLLSVLVPSLAVLQKTPVSIALTIVALLFALFSILTFTGISALVGGGTAAVAMEKDAGLGALLALIMGITAAVLSILTLLTRIKLNTLKQSIGGTGKAQAEKPM